MFENPDLITDEWPTPGVMLWGKKKQKLPPFVSGSRHAVLECPRIHRGFGRLFHEEMVRRTAENNAAQTLADPAPKA